MTPAAAGVAGQPAPGGAGQAAPQVSGTPQSYEVQVSLDGTTWGAPVARGQGTPGEVTIAFGPVQARFIRITQTATPSAPAFWAMQNLKVFAVGGANR